MNKSILISGYGSIGRRHADILSRLVEKKNITILTNQKLSNFRTIRSTKEIRKVNPHYIVVCNPTSDHANKIKYIEKKSDKEISEDDHHQAEDSIQKITDLFVKQEDEVLVKKEAELMEI